MNRLLAQRVAAVFVFTYIALGCLSQSNRTLIRHDTVLLKAGECEWILKSLEKNDLPLTGEIGKSIPQILLNRIFSGKLKAIDPETNNVIPGKEILTWKSRADTVMKYDVNGNMERVAKVPVEHGETDIHELKIFQDWYLDVPTGKISAEIKWVELMLDIRSSSGDFLGLMGLCRIYY